MYAILSAAAIFIADLFKSRRRLRAKNLLLRHQLAIALRRVQPRPQLSRSDRAVLVWITRLYPELLGLTQIVKPDTILRWHRMGFRAYWRWKSRKRAGRPKIDRGLRDLIRQMCLGELLKLGFEIAQSTVSKYMVRGRRPPSQSWKTFLRNHVDGIAAIDLFMVPTVTFDLLYAFLVVVHGRRQLLWIDVTRHPTAAGTSDD